MRRISAFSLSTLPVTSKQLVVASVAFLGLAAVFVVLNLQKSRGLRTEMVQSEAARQAADQHREKQLKAREAAVAAANAKFGDTQNKVASAEAELAKVQTEKNDLQGKLRA